MKRRSFVQSLAALPAAPALVAQQPNTGQSPTNASAPAAPPETPAAQPLFYSAADQTAAPEHAFFSPTQFATLRKLAAVMVPPAPGALGALDTDACEFVDFLLSQSLPPDQALYLDGLDELNRRATSAHHKPFAEITDTQVDAIIQPLMVERHWDVEIPENRMERFMAQVHDDLRLATSNSPEVAAAVNSRGGRRGGGGGDLLLPIDPIYKVYRKG